MQIANNILQERQNGEATIIISSEAFQNIRDLTYVKEFLTALHPEHITIICYFREHLDYAITAYRQFIHAQPHYQTFKEYLAGKFENQKNFIRSWKNLGSMEIKWFDKHSLLNNDITDDFLDVAKLKITMPSLRVNPSIGGDLLFLKLLYNYLGKVLLDYKKLSSISTIQPEWSNPFQVKELSALEIRSHSEYNTSLTLEIGREPYLKSFAKYELPPSRDIEQNLLTYLETNYSFSINKSLVQEIRAGKFSHLIGL